MNPDTTAAAAEPASPLTHIPEGGVAVCAGFPVLFPGTAIARGFKSATMVYRREEEGMLLSALATYRGRRVVLVIVPGGKEIWTHTTSF